MKAIFAFLVCCFISCPLYGQAWSVETTLHRGKILKHTPRLAYSIPKQSVGFTCEWLYQTNGEKPWQEHHNFPLLGLAFRYYYLGDEQVLGHAFSFFPTIHFPLIEKENWGIQLSLGSGLAILTKQYDRIDNPLNNSVGAPLNNITAFSVSFNYKISPKLKVTGQGSFTHFSNAATSLPNLGINIPALALGIQYTPKVGSTEKITGSSKIPARRWGIWAFTGMGFKETATPGGAKWPIYFSSAGLTYRWSKFHNIQAGLDYEFFSSLYQFSLHTFTFATPKEARAGATRFGISILEEFLFGPWAIIVNMGVYISGESILAPYPVYNRLGLRYYLQPIGEDSLQIQLGLYMKSHLISAEYAGLSVGLSW